jgi:hypothetical protein
MGPKIAGEGAEDQYVAARYRGRSSESAGRNRAAQHAAIED